MASLLGRVCQSLGQNQFSKAGLAQFVTLAVMANQDPAVPAQQHPAIDDADLIAARLAGLTLPAALVWSQFSHWNSLVMFKRTERPGWLMALGWMRNSRSKTLSSPSRNSKPDKTPALGSQAACRSTFA